MDVPTYYFGQIFPKLYEIEKICTERGHGSLKSESGVEWFAVFLKDRLNNNCSRMNENGKDIHRKNEEW